VSVVYYFFCSKSKECLIVKIIIIGGTIEMIGIETGIETETEVIVTATGKIIIAGMNGATGTELILIEMKGIDPTHDRVDPTIEIHHLVL
jgi:hypothetical protein